MMIVCVKREKERENQEKRPSLFQMSEIGFLV